MTPQRARVELRTPTPADRDEFLKAMRASRKRRRLEANIQPGNTASIAPVAGAGAITSTG